MYLNLKMEMFKKHVTLKELSRILGMHTNSVSKKINGNVEFSVGEAFKIKNDIFPECELTYLFATE